jgi:hypothetical protein
MNQEREIPKFQGIADSKCRCTPDRLCRRCDPEAPGAFARFFDPRIAGVYFRGKFREPWNAAVAKNNTEVKNERRGDR